VDLEYTASIEFQWRKASFWFVKRFGLGNVDSVFWSQEVLILVAARVKAWVCGRSLVGIVGFEFRWGHGCLFPLSAVCCQV
jgi:hypothetical protein